MRIFLSIFLCYWAFGMLLLPMGDFSALNDLPQEYKNCKGNEDKDMTFVDFITDHLINIDGLFDKHDNGDKQKSHSSTHYVHHNFAIAIIINQKIILVKSLVFFEIKYKYNYEKDNNYSYNYSTSIFHPPLI